MKFLLGNKLEMTQVFQDNGAAVPVTKVVAGPCTVIQVKTPDKDGYTAVQFGYGSKNKKNINKPQLKHFNNLGNFRYVKEMRVLDNEQPSIKSGDMVDVSSFSVGDHIKVTGIAKGRGFQGVVKRHGFAGSLKTHGHKDQHRMPGSVGSTGPAHVFKGVRMGGHMGDNQVTVANLEIVRIDEESNTLYIKGAVPGARNGLIIIAAEGEFNVKTSEVKSSDTDNVDKKNEDIKDDKLNMEPEVKEDKENKNDNVDTNKETDKQKSDENIKDSDKKSQAPKQENKTEQNTPVGKEK